MYSKDPLSHWWRVILWMLNIVGALVTGYFSFSGFSHLYDKLPLAMNVFGIIALVVATVTVASDIWESFNDLHVRDPEE